MAKYDEDDHIEDDDENLEDEIDRGDELLDDDDEEENEDQEDDNLEEDTEEDDDSEDDDSEDDADEEEDSDDDDDQEDPKENRIPKVRLDQVIEQRESEKKRADWLESQLEKLIEQNDKREVETFEEEEELDTFDYDEAESKYAEFLLEGESNKASKVRALINKSRQEDIEALILKATDGATTKATSRSTQIVEDSKFEDLVEILEVKHPFLNIDHDDYDEDMVDTVNTLITGYVASGKTKREGLRLAVAKVVPKESVEPKKKGLGGKRVKEARKTKASASNRQPPSSKSAKLAGKTSKNTSVEKMSDKQFASLTKKEKAALRGD